MLQKIAGPLVGPLFVGALVRPNILNTPKSASDYSKHAVENALSNPSSYQLKSYVAPKSRLKFAARCPVSRCWSSCLLLSMRYVTTKICTTALCGTYCETNCILSNG